jgi:hypothetical protein
MIRYAASWSIVVLYVKLYVKILFNVETHLQNKPLMEKYAHEYVIKLYVLYIN